MTEHQEQEHLEGPAESGASSGDAPGADGRDHAVFTELARLRERNERLERRWAAAKPFVDACFSVWDEAIGNRADTNTLRLEPPRVLEKFDRRLVRSMLSSVIDGLGALHDTFTEEEIDDQLRDSGGDPEQIGKRGAALVQELLEKRRLRSVP